MSGKSSSASGSAAFPPGTIVRRKIRGIYRFYHQWREDGKTKSRYLRAEEVLPLRRLIERRKAAAAADRKAEPVVRPHDPVSRLLDDALTGRMLLEFAHGVDSLKRRTAFASAMEFLRGEHSDAKLLLGGDAGCGRTTLLRHLLLEMTDAERARTCYLHPRADESRETLSAALAELRRRGVRTVLIDDAPVTTDFGGTGMDVVMTAALPSSPVGSLKVIDLSFVPFAEHARLNGNADVDDYLERGGRFGEPEPDRAPRVTPELEDANDRFLLEALADTETRSARPRREAFVFNDLLRLRHRLAEGIVDNAEGAGRREGLIRLAPYLRLRLAERRVDGLLAGPSGATLGAAERKLVRDAVLVRVRRRLLEDVVWRALDAFRPLRGLFTERIRFTPECCGFVRADREEVACEFYVVTPDSDRDDRQLRHLDDPLRIEDIEHRYGIITARTVLSAGRNARHGSGALYRNLADFLVANAEAAADGEGLRRTSSVRASPTAGGADGARTSLRH